MAIIIQKPKRAKKGKLLTPPSKEGPKITNLTKKTSSGHVTLNLRVPIEFRREVKFYATSKDMSIVRVMTEAFRTYKDKNQ